MSAPRIFVSDLAVFVLKRDVKLQPINCPPAFGVGDVNANCPPTFSRNTALEFSKVPFQAKIYFLSLPYRSLLH